MHLSDWVKIGAVRTEYCPMPCAERLMDCVSNGRCERHRAGEAVDLSVLSPPKPQIVSANDKG